jgi:signal transduction histidine kinase
MHKKFGHTILLVIALILLVSLYYLTIYKPSVKVLKANSMTEFTNEVKLRNYMVNNAAKRIIEGAKSMSSRTMIRKKISEHYQHKISFDELKDYTQPKYIDGIKALNYCIYAARYIRSGLLVEYKTDDCDGSNFQSDILDTSENSIFTHIHIVDTTISINVITPIYDKDIILGYDILYTKNEELLRKIENNNYSFDLIPIKSKKQVILLTNQPEESKDSVSLIVESAASKMLHKYSIPKKLLFNEIYSYQTRQVFFVGLLVLSIALFYFVIRQWARIYYYKKGKYMKALVNKKTSQLNMMVEELKAKNEALHNQEDQLKESNKTKDKFFSIIAHDLIGPLGSLVSVFEFLSKPSIEEKTKEKYFKLAKETAQKTFSLLENLLTWARSQRNKLEFNPAYIDLLPIIEDIVGYLDQQATNKEISLKYEIDKNLKVFADQYMIQTIIRNLVSNAIKFTLKGGQIKITGHFTAENQMQISVQDNGVGINPEKLNYLFSLDNNSSSKGTNDEEGTGLGLILCKDFVDKHGGKIWAESEVGKGSTFSFTIPIKKKSGIV